MSFTILLILRNLPILKNRKKRKLFFVMYLISVKLKDLQILSKLLLWKQKSSPEDLSAWRPIALAPIEYRVWGIS